MEDVRRSREEYRGSSRKEGYRDEKRRDKEKRFRKDELKRRSDDERRSSRDRETTSRDPAMQQLRNEIGKEKMKKDKSESRSPSSSSERRERRSTEKKRKKEKKKEKQLSEIYDKLVKEKLSDAAKSPEEIDPPVTAQEKLLPKKKSLLESDTESDSEGSDVREGGGMLLQSDQEMSDVPEMRSPDEQRQRTPTPPPPPDPLADLPPYYPGLQGCSWMIGYLFISLMLI
eukprot:sb/3469481/